jgi:hypothetical protein
MIQPVWRTFAVGTRYLNPFSGEGGTPSTSTLFHPPRAITVYEGTLNGNAPGTGDSFNWQFWKNFSSPSTNGSKVTVSGTDTVDRTTVTATLLAATSDEEVTANYLQWTIGGTPTQTENMLAFSYEDSVDAAVDYHGWGSYSDNIMLGKSIDTNYFTTFGIGGSTTLTATEADVQLVWPVSGAFKYCAVVYSTSGTGAVTLRQRINGADSGFSFDLSAGVAAKTLTSDLTTAVPISAGQTVDWRVSQATSVGLTCAVIVGFIAV